jgi:hypothetical protein
MPKQPANHQTRVPSRIRWEADDAALAGVRGHPRARGNLIPLAILAVLATALGLSFLSGVHISVGSVETGSPSADIPDRQVAN